MQASNHTEAINSKKYKKSMKKNTNAALIKSALMFCGVVGLSLAAYALGCNQEAASKEAMRNLCSVSNLCCQTFYVSGLGAPVQATCKTNESNPYVRCYKSGSATNEFFMWTKCVPCLRALEGPDFCPDQIVEPSGTPPADDPNVKKLIDQLTYTGTCASGG